MTNSSPTRGRKAPARADGQSIAAATPTLRACAEQVAPAGSVARSRPRRVRFVTGVLALSVVGATVTLVSSCAAQSSTVNQNHDVVAPRHQTRIPHCVIAASEPSSKNAAASCTSQPWGYVIEVVSPKPRASLISA